MDGSNRAAARPYTSTRGHANLLAAVAAGQVLAVMGSAVGDGMGEAMSAAWADTFALGCGYAATLLLFTGVVLFVDWVRQATDNLRALGTTAPSFAGAQSVLLLMMPIANIPLSHSVLTALWHESQPRSDGTAPQHCLGAPLVTAWLLALCAAIESVLVVSGSYEREALLVSWVAAGGLFVALVLRTQRRQDEQWRDLELRRRVPRPCLTALR